MIRAVGAGLLAQAVLLLAVPGETLAATRLIVTVRNQTGQALLTGAVVCVGTAANRAAHGRIVAASGIADFAAVPNGAWVITAWRTGFGTAERSMSVTSATIPTTTAAFALTTGSAADPCSGGGAPVPPPAPAPAAPVVRVDATVSAVADTPAITLLTINNAMESTGPDNPVYLTLKHTGPVTEYRVSEVSAQFPEGSAAWRPFVLYPGMGGSLRMPSSGSTFASVAPVKTVFVQLRNGTRVSNVASDTINLTQRYSVSGRNAAQVARANGFTFATGGYCVFDQNAGREWITLIADILTIEHTCAMTLFGGRALASGWRNTGLKWRAVVINGGNCRVTGTPPLPTSQIYGPFIFQGASCAFDLTIELHGPAGVPWADAFAR